MLSEIKFFRKEEENFIMLVVRKMKIYFIYVKKKIMRNVLTALSFL